METNYVGASNISYSIDILYSVTSLGDQNTANLHCSNEQALDERKNTPFSRNILEQNYTKALLWPTFSALLAILVNLIFKVAKPFKIVG